MLPRVVGIAPVNKFSYKSKLTNFVKFPSSAGIVPIKEFEYNSLRY